jgi:CxxC motif-containing protein
MIKKSVGIILVLAFVIFVNFLSIVSADIFLSTQPETNYNFGDTLSVVLGSDGAVGWANVDLICNDQTKMLYFHYVNDASSASINAPLTTQFLGGMIGTCHLALSFNNQQKNSFDFIISNHIDSSITFSGNSFKSGESLYFTGSVSKPNRKQVAGSVELKFEGLDLGIVVPVINNQFSGNLTLPSNIAAGSYGVSVFVSEKNELGDVINSGSANTQSIIIVQKPTTLSLNIPKSAMPGNDLSFDSVLLDQTGMIIDKSDVAYKLSDVNGKDVYNKLANTGETIYINLAKNAPYGYWTLNAESEGVSADSQVYVEKNREALFELINNTLHVLNVGNIPYDKSIEIKIGNETKVKNLNLSVGSSMKFQLTAPDGAYDVSISDGDDSQNWLGVPLTGNIISIDGSKKKSSLGLFNGSWLAWIFIIAVLGLFIFLSSRKIINKNMILSSKNTPNYAKDQDKKGGVIKVTPTSENKPPVFEHDTGIASHSSVIDGTKQSASLIAIKLKNYRELKDSKSNANDTLKTVINEITENKGKVYRTDDFIIGIFSPIITRTFDNSFMAVKTANVISNKLKEYNSKFLQKINFGVAVHTGDIVAKKDAGKLLFTPLGATLTSAKKIAEIADNNVLLSEDAQKKVMSQVKTTLNPEKFGVKTYSISEIVDRQNNSKFIESFLQRNQEFKALRDLRSGK